MKRPLFFLIACLHLGAVAADEDVLSVLDRMQDAVQRLNYQGTLVYFQGGQVQSMHIVHKADEKGEYERLVNLNGPAREVIRSNNVVTCYMPDHKSVLVGERKYNSNVLGKLVANDFSSFQNYYQFQIEGDDRVAGLAAQRVLIKPRDTYRYGYRLWLDRNNGLLLKFDLLAEDGQALEQAMFADIRVVDQIPDAMLAPTTASEGFAWFKQEKTADSAEAPESAWHIRHLPVGFAITARFHHPLPNSDAVAEHVIASDGLASVSVYIEKLSENRKRFVGGSNMGAVNAFGAVVDDHQITVIGEVPGSTVQVIASSVTRQQKDAER